MQLWSKPIGSYARLALLLVGGAALLAVSLGACMVPVGMLGGAGSGEPAEIALDDLEQRSYVYSADGSVLAGLRGEINRQPVGLEDVPQHLIDAIVAVEDQGFWIHDGVDARGILRALKVNVDAGSVSQGGSTLTQQVVKLSLLGDEQSLERKVQELILARRLEKEMSKEEILTRYINMAYFGYSAYGVQAAAETYFGIDAAELDVGQSALLAGIINNPRFNDPVVYPESADARRQHALQRMEDDGYITPDQRDWFDNSPLPTEVHEVIPEPDDYFVEQVKTQLLTDERFDALGTTYEERERTVFQGGLQVHTTFDPPAQRQAIIARNEVLPGPDAVFPAGTDARGQPMNGTGAMVSIDPATGAVRTMVAGPGFDRGVEGATGEQYNLVTDNQRQIGSTHKVFTLTRLMEAGYSPDDIVDGTGPCTFANPGGSPNPYNVRNFGNSPGSVGTVLEQTLRSSNCAYVRLALIAGRGGVRDTARALGVVRSEIGTNLASALGTSEVTPLEMASAYATLANDGVYNAPYYIERIEGPDGRIVYEHQPNEVRAVSSPAARLVTSVLTQNVQRGTGTAAAVSGQPAAGKTGTTTDQADVWFVGYTPYLATAVWVGGLGSNDPITIAGETPSSSRHPARMFGMFMNAYHQGLPYAAFPPDPGRAGGGFLRADPSIDPSGGNEPPPQPQPDTRHERPERSERRDRDDDDRGNDRRDDRSRPSTTTEPRPDTTTTTLPPFTVPTLPTTTTTTTQPGPGNGNGSGGGGGRDNVGT